MGATNILCCSIWYERKEDAKKKSLDSEEEGERGETAGTGGELSLSGIVQSNGNRRIWSHVQKNLQPYNKMYWYGKGRSVTK